MNRILALIALSATLLTLAAQTPTPVAAAADTTAAAASTANSAAVWTLRLRAKLDSLTRQSPLAATTQIGLLVYDLTADSAIYACGQRQTLRPASTMKLLTAITALEQLGPDCRLTTTLSHTGTISGGTLQGNLVCTGGMDPLVGPDDLDAMVSQLRQMGVDTLRGSIVEDLSFKDGNRSGEGWCWDDDNPVLSPLLCDRKDTFAQQLERRLRRAGVTVLPPATPAASSATRQRLTPVARLTHSLEELLAPMMKESDNLYAEALYYQLAAKAGHRPATGRQAAAQVKRMIQKVGLRPSDYKVADGSGLSLYNYVSAELEVRLLRYAYRHAPMGDVLKRTLPLAGVDGTLKSRMTTGAATGRVCAKTGTLTGISSLAGYCATACGHELAFCIINQGVLHTADARAFQDSVCQAMTE